MAAGKKALIIGAGLAGLSLATELVDEGFQVEILEKNGSLGGRASDLVDHKMHDPVPIGPHVFVGWYNNFFRFLRKIEARRLIKWERTTLLEIVHQGRHHKLRFHRLPAPLFIFPWLISYPFMSVKDKLSNRRILADIYFSSEKKIEQLDSIDAYQYLIRQKVTPRCIEMFWRFIVLSLLNVPLEECSAAEFAMLVKRWAYLKRRKFGFPKVGLGDIYADEAQRYIEKYGGKIRRNCAVTDIVAHEGRVVHLVAQEDGRTIMMKPDIVVSTLNPTDLKSILPANMRASSLYTTLSTFTPVPYFSVNIWFDEKISHKQFWAMLSGDGKEYLNTDFYDLSNIYDEHRGGSYIASNIIYSGRYSSFSDKWIVEKTLAEIREVFPHANAQPIHSHVHRIPYVIYAPLPGSRGHKVGPQTDLSNLFLAGDWTVREIPQCMEAAVRSGYKCAEAILGRYDIEKKICDERVY